uniref:LamG-like jellyroll fold domain-containing protein n=1 Tax=Lutibacter sp. TaxID=1925666 RepID=UPI00356A0B6A
TLTTDRNGNLERAYSFDGVNDIITVNHSTNLNMEGELSISVWVKPTTLSNAMILGKSNYTSNTNYLLRTKTTGFLQFEYKKYANSTNNPLIAGQWNHIAVISEADNTKKIYVNNVLSTHTESTSPYGVVTDILTIGARSGAEFFQGAIDDLRIYNKALSEAEILNLYNYNTLKVEKIEDVANSSFYVFNNTLYFKNTQNLNEIKTIEVYNLLGQQVFKTSDIQEVISLQQLQKGIYILKVKTSNTNQSLKFIIN